MSLWGRYMSFRQIASCWAILLPVLFPAASNALPSFAQQTGQPCSQCHVGAYGPQLKQYGRDFKLYGYVSGDGQNWLPPISLSRYRPSPTRRPIEPSRCRISTPTTTQYSSTGRRWPTPVPCPVRWGCFPNSATTACATCLRSTTSTYGGLSIPRSPVMM